MTCAPEPKGSRRVVEKESHSRDEVEQILRGTPALVHRPATRRTGGHSAGQNNESSAFAMVARKMHTIPPTHGEALETLLVRATPEVGFLF